MTSFYCFTGVDFYKTIWWQWTSGKMWYTAPPADNGEQQNDAALTQKARIQFLEILKT